MNIGTLWFDRLRNRLRQEPAEQENLAIPGLFEDISAERLKIFEELNAAQPLIIGADVSKRIAPNGEPSEDLKYGFSIPFNPSFIEFDPAVKLPEFHEGKIRGIWVSKTGKTSNGDVYFCRVWTEKYGGSRYYPALSFYFAPSTGWVGKDLEQAGESESEDSGNYDRVANFLMWLSGYISSPNVLAIRHNRRHDLVRSYVQRGLLPPSSYYTFEPERMPQTARKPFGGKTMTVEVRGYFRRAHWHRLAGGGSAWFHTSWVRPHKRHVPVAGNVQLEKAA